MSSIWAFYPRPGGTKRRGLEVGTSGTLAWAACRTNDTRSESIFLPGPKADAEISVEKDSVIKVKYGTKPIQGFWPVIVESVGPGTSYIEAKRGSDYCYMVVTVFPQLIVNLTFKKVETEKWKSNLTIGKMNRLVENLNYIYSYQGNIAFAGIGSPQKTTISGLGDVFDTDDIDEWSEHRDCSVDATLLFVKETDALAVNWSDLIVMEDSQKYPWDEMTCAHEIGHRLGLRHPEPSLPFNLMNQTGVGDRNRMKIYLNRTQIETVTNRSKWKQRLDSVGSAHVCVAPGT